MEEVARAARIRSAGAAADGERRARLPIGERVSALPPTLHKKVQQAILHSHGHSLVAASLHARLESCRTAFELQKFIIRNAGSFSKLALLGVRLEMMALSFHGAEGRRLQEEEAAAASAAAAAAAAAAGAADEAGAAVRPQPPPGGRPRSAVTGGSRARRARTSRRPASARVSSRQPYQPPPAPPPFTARPAPPRPPGVGLPDWMKQALTYRECEGGRPLRPPHVEEEPTAQRPRAAGTPRSSKATQPRAARPATAPAAARTKTAGSSGRAERVAATGPRCMLSPKLLKSWLRDDHRIEFAPPPVLRH